MASLSVVIPTYNRGQVLLDTVQQLLTQTTPADEIILVDQTCYAAGDKVAQELAKLATRPDLVWLTKEEPSIPKAMNEGLRRADSQWVLFIDDDITVASDFIDQHKRVVEHAGALAHVGQVVQPWQQANDPASQASGEDKVLGLNKLSTDLAFAFNSRASGWVRNCMAGNLCVNRQAAIAAGF